VPKRAPPATPNPGPPMFAPNPDFKDVVPYPATMDIHLNLLRLNDIAITGVSGEVFTRIYWHLRKESPLADTLMVTMSNGRIGYLGDDAEYGNGFGNPSVVKGCAENGIVSGLVELMKGQR
jgi:hypothetical protein